MRLRIGLIGAVVLTVALALPALAGARAGSGVRGTVLDTTCADGCMAECPPPPTCRGPHACPQAAGASIVCPLARRSALVCTQAGCPGPPVVRYPLYEGDAATVLVRRAGSPKVLLRLAVEGGHFKAHLAPGRYVVRVHVGLPCWTGTRQLVEVLAGRWTPTALKVNDACVVHPDG